MKPRRRSSRLITRRVDDEVLVYDLDDHHAHRLNPTAALVFELADGSRTEAQIARELSGRLSLENAAPLLELTLGKLAKAKLMETEVPPPKKQPRMTRRKLLEHLKVAAVLLPVVSSLLAPAPVSAASYVTSNNCRLRGTNSASCAIVPRKCEGSISKATYKSCKSTKTRTTCVCA